MRKHQFAFSRHCDADAATVMRLLDDVDNWASWARPFALRARWQTWGHATPAGPGAVRMLGAPPVWIKELILSHDDHGQTYTVISPPLFASYLGQVTISESDLGGVDVDWRVAFTARFVGMGSFARTVLEVAVSGLLERLVSAAERDTRVG